MSLQEIDARIATWCPPAAPAAPNEAMPGHTETVVSLRQPLPKRDKAKAKKHEQPKTVPNANP
jgi:hypothetical protein